jgi:hypothetical protein
VLQLRILRQKLKRCAARSIIIQKPSGSGEDFSKKCFAYQLLRFLLDVDTPRGSYSIEKVS